MTFDGTQELLLSDGTVLPALIKCKKCLCWLSSNFKYCPHCGKRNIEKND